MQLITLKLNNFLNDNFRKKTNIIVGNYINNYNSTHILLKSSGSSISEKIQNFSN